MFRDLYHNAASKIEDWTSGSKGTGNASTPQESFLDHPISNLASGVSETGKYVAKSLIKSAIYMAPAVVPFWMVRIPLDLDNALIMDPKKGMLTAKDPEHNFTRRDPKRWKELGGQPGYNETLFSHITSADDDPGKDYRPTSARTGNLKDLHGGGTEEYQKPQNIYMDGDILSKKGGIGKDLENGTFDPKDKSYRKSIISKFLRPVTDLGNRYEKKVEKIFNHAYEKDTWFSKQVNNLYKGNMKSQNVSSVIAHDFVRGSMAYTPYMIAKAESANLYDTPEMDASIYRMLDGVTSLDGTEFKAGLEDIGRAITLNPVSKVTQAKVYDGRGIAHSKQRDADQRAKKQGSILTTHHEASKLVSQLKKEHAAKVPESDAEANNDSNYITESKNCLLYTSPSPRDQRGSRMPSSA